ncbi:hypothetical protein G6F57_000635 [Rhizopus arrhizus]|uniref:Protein kinase domain-containing protein n=1 Tax=Rhizopus oryzae TaxID=64495 RepID=A0A9P6XJK3_RHIOR|nr:hypothetical protein G6F23_009748 [Rhizopus arrhizus]KAG1429102.1 hypothetical protein G6F58_000233 [Rhizopus delemar]KAG0769738.1 hypothetical protein G6F24_000824 [Rhizopus arrhizus]KAG0797839.1 hypothetical protein G6F21_000191 [Rhizopus arrhizus]KAG0801368.1 hypothetical protein G6F22_001316 [Rhizopus arrhizus]
MPKIDLNTVKVDQAEQDPKDTPQEREQRTIREMAIMRLLRHPHICQLKEYVAEQDKYYMFLEYVDGGQLLDYIIQHGRLKERQARKFAHLKIENILLTKSEQIKIIDFGLSNLYSPTQQLDTFCGSLYFAAPELLKAKEYTGPEVDVWSFGIVLYVLVCGKVPFDDTNLPALHEKIKRGQVDHYPDHLGKDCLDLLSKIFVVNPSERITLSAIRSHPWMNKGFDEPVQNYLPHRQPLVAIDPSIVQGMQGFGLGPSIEIQTRLEKIISSKEYQAAAAQIDENYQKRLCANEIMASRPRWRRRLSSSSRIKHQEKDDFWFLPAMYDPLVSIYYLVKERREAEERKQQLLNMPPHVGLTRSASALTQRKMAPPLIRRRTLDASKQPLAQKPPLPSPSPSIRSDKPQESSRPRPSWKRISHRHFPSSSPIPTPNPSEKGLLDYLHRGQLFRLTIAQMVHQILTLLPLLAIEVEKNSENRIWCRTSYWSRHLDVPNQERSSVPLRFSISVYTVLWSSQKTGFRLIQEDEVSVASFYAKEVLRNLYSALVNKILVQS